MEWSFWIFFASTIAMQYFGGNGTDVALTIGVLSLIKLFVVGVIASATMVIPGVSGSMMLMIMGYYNPIMKAITDFVKAATSGDWGNVLHIGDNPCTVWYWSGTWYLCNR